jgi:CDP-2,3-bis-(O-geranylgeranyl)-sn-glycerol synthase
MNDFFVEFWRALYFLISPYAANGFPPLAKGKHPIDFGKNFIDGKRLFGDGKTWEGLAAGLTFGTFCGTIAWIFYEKLNKIALSHGFSLPYISPLTAFMLSLGALLGDIMGSFIKRRLGMKRGEPAPLLDQLDFIFGASLFGIFLTDLNIKMFIIMLFLTPIIHRIANIIGYLLKIKKEPW